jgi:hypothetical protein
MLAKGTHPENVRATTSEERIFGNSREAMLRGSLFRLFFRLWSRVKRIYALLTYMYIKIFGNIRHGLQD